MTDRPSDAEVEAAARVLYVREGGRDYRWPDVWGPAREQWVNNARAALEAAAAVRLAAAPSPPVQEDVHRVGEYYADYSLPTDTELMAAELELPSSLRSDQFDESKIAAALRSQQAEIARLQDAGWRDIASAPYEQVLVWAQLNDGKGDRAGGAYFIATKDAEGWYDADSGEAIFSKITHWRPLPEPPAQEGK